MANMAGVHLVPGENEAAAEDITQRLISYNLAHTSAFPAAPQEPQPLHLFAYSAEGKLIGGLLGRTHAISFWFEVSILWVDESHRHRGVARHLMERAEQEATTRGCTYARLATSDYQAPGFYARLGYVPYGELANCPPGETVTYFWKALASST